MKQIIINADDFGRHPAINRAVIRGFKDGCISSTSLMPSGLAFDDAVQKACACSGLGIGVHLTLVGEKPVLDPTRISSLVDEEGRFYRDYPQFLSRFLKGKIRLSEIRIELEAQVEKSLQCGLNITHIDSHQHLHVLPGIIDIVLNIAQRYGINAMRVPQIPLSFTGGYPYTFGQLIGRSGLALLAQLAKHKALKRKIFIPDHFYGIVAGGSLREPYLLDIIRNLSPGTSEVMIHPGDGDAELAAECGWQHHFEEELSTVLSKEASVLLQQKQIKLVPYSTNFKV